MNEKQGFSVNGYIVVFIILSIAPFALINISHSPVWFFLLIADLACLIGLFMVQPNQGRVLTLFGSYAGTIKTPGLRWTIPFYIRKNMSLRLRNFESSRIKVNDAHGNPIEIATVVVWSVKDTYDASFEVDDYAMFVNIQSEAALRNMSSCYPYDQQDSQETSLRSDPEIVSEALKTQIQERLNKAGIHIHEARISHLAYAPEIASAMLQRQQASAIIAARQKIVDGAVGMVDMALTQLSQREIVELDEERKAAMVSNLLVVLCSERNTQPVVNAGSLY
ncbi:SPFH domain-containing protein [Pseudoalteromonas denitrificans]|uniref:SPFH domain / Band 7 family protein n=1 Tax=Pseudoalteromonas denitrificans DSM 6059 TaxID=1123010 RepID=A0A1I1QAG0_9GAMM|nr:SPFH domain-containing protein [Pseudoalteromonas denitrificans]SFD19055.1 SPFH domain / Band 7 family protein [Pseudoalteromonas denitrificans DSM 6059]